MREPGYYSQVQNKAIQTTLLIKKIHGKYIVSKCRYMNNSNMEFYLRITIKVSQWKHLV